MMTHLPLGASDIDIPGPNTIQVSKMAERGQKMQESLKDILSKFARIINIPVTFDKGNTVATMSLPGLAYKDLTRAGIPAVWHVLREVEMLWLLQARYPEYQGQPCLGPSGQIPVMGAQTIHLTRAFYDQACLDLPMTYTTCPGRIGRRTLTLLGHLGDKSTGRSFVEVEWQVAFVDGKTRQVVDLPANMRLLFEEHGAKDKPALKIPIPARPEEVFTYSCTVSHSDTNLLYHANQSVYVKYCMDCAATAQNADFLPNMTKDIMATHVDWVSVLYKSQSFINDNLDVVTWPDETSPLTLHFQIRKNGVKIVFCTIKFYGQDTKSKL